MREQRTDWHDLSPDLVSIYLIKTMQKRKRIVTEGDRIRIYYVLSMVNLTLSAMALLAVVVSYYL